MCGPALISNPASLKKIVETVTLIIHKEHPCQQDDFDNDPDPDAEGLDESPEMDWLTIDTALDVVSGLAVALGPQFPELWKIYEKSIMTFVSSSEGIERSAAVGVLAECITGMGAAVTPYTSSMLKVLLKRLSDEHQQTKSNAAYAIGRLCENTTSDAEILKAYPSILAKLEPLLHIRGTERMQDNAAGCVSRMILKHKDAIPIKDVLPVLVGLLPLKKDYEENEPIYNCIAALCTKAPFAPFPPISHSLAIFMSIVLKLMYIVHLDKVEDPTIRALTPQLIPVFKVVLAAEGQLSDETKAVVVQLAQYLKGMNPQWDCGV
jgi:importin-4